MKQPAMTLGTKLQASARLALIGGALLLVAACSSDNAAPGATLAVEVAPPATATATATPAPPTATTPPQATAVEAPPDTPTVAPTASETPAPAPTATSLPEPDLSTLNLELETVTGGLDRPVFATHAGDGSGRIFIVEKGGTILALGPDGDQPQPFLEIADRVGSDASEQGLLGLAFHPDFAANGRFFVYYTDKDGDTVIARFQASEDRSTADPDSEVVLLTQSQPAGNHNGGMIAFGPDGYLYAGLGDGGGSGDDFGSGQNLTTILATILRINVEGDAASVPASNPFVGQDGARAEIWAYGLRNPWRFSFDRATGDLWIGDVGQNQWEEINFQPAGSPGGENYGWPITEAMHCYDADSCDRTGLIEPVAEYEHGNDCSVTGGYVYRGAQQPAMQGVYFYGDYCSGRVRGLAPAADGQWQNAELLESGAQISSFGETEDGELLVVDYDGILYRLTNP